MWTTRPNVHGTSLPSNETSDQSLASGNFIAHAVVPGARAPRSGSIPIHTASTGWFAVSCEAVLARLDAELDRVPDLPPLSDARFLETHRAFEERSEQRTLITESLCRRARRAELVQRPRRVLAVGCGAGDVDVPLARAMAARCEEVVYIGLDPNREECAATERLFEQEDPACVRFELEVGTFEDFDSGVAFDVIHFVHSLYYLDDPAAALVKARRMLAPGGQLVVVQAPREELNELAVRFYDRQFARPTLFAEDFAALLTEWKWAFERVRLDATVDLTPILDDGSELGAALTDFVCQVDARSLASEIQRLIDLYLRRISRVGGDRLLAPHPVDAFFIDG